MKNGWVTYQCKCIEGPHPAVSCWQHGQPVKEKYTTSPSPSPAKGEGKERGVAQYIECVKGRPIQVWIINDRCNGAMLCPSRYGCKYKPPQGKLL